MSDVCELPTSLRLRLVHLKSRAMERNAETRLVEDTTLVAVLAVTSAWSGAGTVGRKVY